MSYNVIEGKLVKVVRPSDASETLAVIETAQSEGKKFYIDSLKGIIRIDEGLKIPNELLHVFSAMSDRIIELESGDEGSFVRGFVKRTRKEKPLSKEGQELKADFDRISQKIENEEALTAEEKKRLLFITDRTNDKRAFKPKRLRDSVSAWLEKNRK